MITILERTLSAFCVIKHLPVYIFYTQGNASSDVFPWNKGTYYCWAPIFNLWKPNYYSAILLIHNWFWILTREKGYGSCWWQRSKSNDSNIFLFVFCDNEKKEEKQSARQENSHLSPLFGLRMVIRKKLLEKAKWKTDWTDEYTLPLLQLL